MKLAMKLIFEHYKAHRAEEPKRHSTRGAEHKVQALDHTQYYDRRNHVPTKALRLPHGINPSLALEIGGHHVS